MRITLKHLRKLVSEEMMPGPTGTPDQTLSTANNKSDDAGFTQMQKAAMGFMNNSMGTSPSSDQLDGMHSELNNYAQQKGVSPAGLKSSLQKILPSSSTHPDYQYDSGSGAVSSSDGRKIYGEMRITKRQLRRIIKEELFKEVSWYEDQLEEEEAIVNAIRTGSLEVSTIAMVSGLGGPHVRKLLNSLEKRGVVTKKPKPATASRRVPDTWHIKESVLKTVHT